MEYQEADEPDSSSRSIPVSNHSGHSLADSEMELNDDNIFTDLPDALIITNIHEQVFIEPNTKAIFEETFKDFDETVTFQYLKNFRRARVNFSLPELAVKAKIHLHDTEVCGKNIKCYIAQPKYQSMDGETHLQLPPPEKQFLISPPASPPVGWEPVHEGEPVINYDLISAIASLTPGESHELHPPSDKHPAIVVHICEDNPSSNSGQRPQQINRTRCPERSS